MEPDDNTSSLENPLLLCFKFNDTATTKMMAVKTPEALPILPWEEKHKK